MQKEHKEKLKNSLQKNKVILGALAVAVVASGAATLVTFADSQQTSNGGASFAHRWQHPDKQNITDEQRDSMKATFEAARTAVEQNDFAAWQQALADHPKGDEFVTQEKFDVLVQAYQLRQSGDTEGAKQLLKDSGVQPHGKFNMKKLGGDHEEMNAQHQAIEKAFEDGDYNAWASLMAENDHFDAAHITQENFSKLQQAHQLHESGDHEQARQIMKEVFGDDFKGGVHQQGRKRPGRAK